MSRKYAISPFTRAFWIEEIPTKTESKPVHKSLTKANSHTYA